MTEQGIRQKRASDLITDGCELLEIELSTSRKAASALNS